MSASPSSTQIDILVLFTLRDLRLQPGRWGMYINQLAKFESQSLRDAFYNSNRPDIPLCDHPELLRHAETLVRELRAVLPPVEPIEEGGVRFLPSGDLWAVTHYTRWESYGPEFLEWVRDLRFGDRAYIGAGHKGRVEIERLSAAAKAAIRVLDGFATERAYRRHMHDVQSFASGQPIELPPPRKAKVFISYRRSQLDTAKRIFDLLNSYGHHAHFSPFVDEHHPESGNLLERLLEEIEQSDLFMPLVSSDYAEPETISVREYEKARQVTVSRHRDDFFAPVLLRNPNTEIAHVLSKDFYLAISCPEDLQEDHPEVRQFLRGCLASALQA